MNNAINYDEKSLIARFYCGDSSAFDELVAPYVNRLYSTAVRITGNTYDAEDACQEALIKAYLKLVDFKGNSSIYTYLYRITVNCCLDIVRKHKDNDDINDVNIKSTVGEPEKEAYRSCLNSEIELALMKLSADFRAAVVLIDVNGFSYEEAAKMLDVSVGTLKSRVHRGRLKLRNALKECGVLTKP